MDQTDFANSLATLNLSAVMCRGFEEEAFGAIQGLFRFRALTDGGRHAWDKAVTRAMADRIPTGQRTSRAFFYSMLRQLRFVAYGTGSDLKSINDSEALVANPWTLSDTEFAYCYVYVRDGNDAVLKEYDKGLLSADEKTVGSWVLTVGQYTLTKFLKTAAPEFMTETGAVLEGLSGWILAAQIVKEAVGFALKKYSARDLRRRYELDSVRREHLNSIGQGNFVGVSMPAQPSR